MVRTALGALCLLPREREVSIIFDDMNAYETITEAMVIHRAEPGIQQDACAVLSNAFVDVEKQQVDPNVFKNIVEAIKTYMEVVSVFSIACFALKELHLQQ